MAHKVHPKAFRVKETADWYSRWFERKNYVQSLREDFLIRDYLTEKLKECGVEHIEIERFAGKTNVIINSARPGLIIGRGGSGIEELKKQLVKLLPTAGKNARPKELRLEIREIKNPWESATLTAQWIAQQLERRMPFRKVLKQTIGKVTANKIVQGVKFEVSGRLGGAEIARREGLRKGRLPLQTLRADIDYGFYEANTTYGTIGVKVWIYKGDTFD